MSDTAAEQKDNSKKEMPDFKVGDTVRVFTKIFEQDKVRLHPFEGTVISKKAKGGQLSFTVRKVSFGEGIERVFPILSTNIEKIELVKAGKVKRAKLYYLRGKVGREAKV